MRTINGCCCFFLRGVDRPLDEGNAEWFSRDQLVAYELPTAGAGSGVTAVGMQDCLGDLSDTVHGDAGPLFDCEGMVGGLQFDERTLAERTRVNVRLEVRGAG